MCWIHVYFVPSSLPSKRNPSAEVQVPHRKSSRWAFNSLSHLSWLIMLHAWLSQLLETPCVPLPRSDAFVLFVDNVSISGFLSFFPRKYLSIYLQCPVFSLGRFSLICNNEKSGLDDLTNNAHISSFLPLLSLLHLQIRSFLLSFHHCPFCFCSIQ